MSDVEPLVYFIDPDEEMGDIKGLCADAAVETRFFSSAEDFLANFDASRVSCLVTDCTLPGMNSLDLMRRLRECGHFVPTILLAECSEVSTVVAAVKAGAKDCVEKEAGNKRVFDKICETLHLARRPCSIRVKATF